MTRGVARLGDQTIGECRCGHKGQIKGKIISASPDTNANGRGVARLGDKTFGCYVATIITASPDWNCN